MFSSGLSSKDVEDEDMMRDQRRRQLVKQSSMFSLTSTSTCTISDDSEHDLYDEILQGSKASTASQDERLGLSMPCRWNDSVEQLELQMSASSLTSLPADPASSSRKKWTSLHDSIDCMLYDFDEDDEDVDEVVDPRKSRPISPLKSNSTLSTCTNTSSLLGEDYLSGLLEDMLINDEAYLRVDDETSETVMPGVEEGRVRFAPNVEVREYAVIVGDNPSCKGTCALQLDWEFVDYSTPIPLEGKDETVKCYRSAGGRPRVRRLSDTQERRSRVASVQGWTEHQVADAETEMLLNTMDEDLYIEPQMGCARPILV